jgi:hypothetical protein
MSMLACLEDFKNTIIMTPLNQSSDFEKNPMYVNKKLSTILGQIKRHPESVHKKSRRTAG